MGKQQTKALHLQKSQSQSSCSKLWGERKFGLRVWPSHPNQNETTRWLYDHLGAFHNSKKAINLSNLAKHFNCEDGIDFLSPSTQAILPFDHAEFLLSIAKTNYVEVDDYWGSKVLILTAYLIYQSKTLFPKEIVSIVKECFKSEGGIDVDEGRLACKLPWCFDGYNAVKSVDGMKNHLDNLDPSELKHEVAATEATITLNVMKDGHTHTEMKFNSLINLNTVLKLAVGKEQKITQLKVKHAGVRVFLSSAGRKTISQLGMADNDVLEIEDSINTVPQPSDTDDLKENTAATSNRRKKKNKKKSKTKKNKSY
mmetsp:Transcript_12611/g.19427  ORF Transcript_12611/g.19427 Transcript_12611/m.19427 type:complete len:312 (-) Transcript_12611:294-1229(-)